MSEGEKLFQSPAEPDFVEESEPLKMSNDRATLWAATNIIGEANGLEIMFEQRPDGWVLSEAERDILISLADRLKRLNKFIESKVTQ